VKRIKRNCNRPLRGDGLEDRRDRSKPSTCPVVDIPAWVFRAYENGPRYERASISDLARIPANSFQRTRRVYHAIEQAKRAYAEHQRKLKEQMQAAGIEVKRR